MENAVVLDSTPDWIDGLIIYEIATKAFTSPSGPESGTFDSLREKLPYLSELGVTGIWLSGHSLSDSRHFYNIWTQYACILPDRLDPSLGTATSFKRLVEEAHALNLKVFLDVITHGVMSDSPLIEEKPHWFKGGSWGMTDYDWFGGHADLDDWWVDLWVSAVTEYGIDGYRLDVATYRPDLWSRIRRRVAEAGHPIVIFPELGPAYRGVSDFIQWGERLSTNHSFAQDHPFLTDVATAVRQAVQPAYEGFHVRFEYADGSNSEPDGEGDTQIQIESQESYDVVYRGPSGEGPYAVQEMTLALSGVAVDKVVDNVIVTHPSNFWPWKAKGNGGIDFSVRIEGVAPSLRLVIPMRFPSGQRLSVQLSCHDNGWEGFPLDQNPYAAEGSRFVFGYGLLLTPAVPIFMAGEEFNADFVPLPTLSPKVFAGEQAGQGRWLYGSWIQWDQLADEEKAAMLVDVKRIIRIRRNHSDLIRPAAIGRPCLNLVKVPCHASVDLPAPYLYWDKRRCILVAGNPYPDRAVSVRFDVPFSRTGFGAADSLRITDLWNGGEAAVATADALGRRQFHIQPDRTARGGLLVLAIEKGGNTP